MSGREGKERETREFCGWEGRRRRGESRHDLRDSQNYCVFVAVRVQPANTENGAESCAYTTGLHQLSHTFTVYSVRVHRRHTSVAALYCCCVETRM